MNLEFNIRKDPDGSLWTLRHSAGLIYRHYFADPADVARTFYLNGVADAERRQDVIKNGTPV